MPNQRSNPRPRRTNLSPNLVARLDLYGRVFTLKWAQDEEDGDRLSLLFGVQPALKWMDLLSLPMGDLLILKKMFDLAIETAMPIVAQLDAEAEQAWEEGVGVARRLYRPPAHFLNFGAPPPEPKIQPDPTEQGDEDVDTGEHPGIPE